MPKRISLLTILFFLFALSCTAQKYLALDLYRMTGLKRIYFHEGDNISFRLTGDKIKYTGEIQHITDSTVLLKDMDVPVKMIGVIYRDKSNFLTQSFSKAFIYAGAGFVLIDTFNNAVNGSATILDKRAVIAGASLAAVGFVMRIVTIRKYKLGNKRMLKVLNTNSELSTEK